MTGLELIKTPTATAGEIADIISEHCPPVVPEDCDRLACRECWLSWLTTGEPPKEKGPSNERTTPGENAEQVSQEAAYQCAKTRELRLLVQKWQEKNRAPYSALKICLGAVLAAEEKRLAATPDHSPGREA